MEKQEITRGGKTIVTLWPGSLEEYQAAISAGASHVSLTEEEVRAWGLDVELVPLTGEAAADAVLAGGDAFHELLDSMQQVVSDTDLLNMTDEELGRMLRETGILQGEPKLGGEDLEPTRVETQGEFDAAADELMRTGRPIEAPSAEALEAWGVDREDEGGGVEGR